MVIRPEEPRDWRAIHAVEVAAFPSTAEAELVDALRRAGAAPLISLVADDAGAIVGHALFSPVTLECRGSFTLMGLGPMAVAPERQRSGIGSALVREGLSACKRAGVAGVVVLGHPEYYPRFGFVPASRFGIRSEYETPDEAFMVLELAPGALAARTGTVRYHPAFAAVAQGVVVLLVAVIVLGVTSGALLTEGAVLVPFWRGLAPNEFLAWYRQHAALLFRFFGSLEIVATLATLGALAMCWHATGIVDGLLVTSTALCIAVLLAFPAYFQHVNERFERGTIAADDVGPELARWARWHWLRTAMALGAFVAALMAHGTRSPGA